MANPPTPDECSACLPGHTNTEHFQNIKNRAVQFSQPHPDQIAAHPPPSAFGVAFPLPPLDNSNNLNTIRCRSLTGDTYVGGSTPEEPPTWAGGKPVRINVEH